MMRRRILAVLVCFALADCTKVGGAAFGERHAWTKPGVLRIADIADPDHFNPLLSTMDLVEDLSSLVYSYLVIADGDGKLVGDLATEVPSLANGGISKDGRRYTYRLRAGVVWHDGKPFGARDVVATWRAVVNQNNNVLHREGYEEVERIDTPDQRTLVVHLRRRYPPFVTQFFTTLQEGSKGILPAHVLDATTDLNKAPINSAPIGTGPFKFVKWDRGRGMDFVANERYFKGRPKLDKIEFRVLPDDNTILNSMQTHETDLVVSVPSALYERYGSVDGVKAALYPWNAETVFIINNSKPGLRHIEVRRALASAMDYPTIINKITHGVGVTAYDIIPPSAIGYTKNPPYTYDPAAANALLDANGWKRGADGVRQKNGERLAFTMTLSGGSATARNVSLIAQAALHAVGMDLTLKSYPYNVIFAYDGPIKNGTYDFATYSYTLPYDPNYTVYLACDEAPPKGENDFRFCDPQVDAGEREGLSTDDPAKRAAIYHRVQRRIHDDVPYIPLYLGRRPTARSVDLKNFSPAPSIAPWWNAYQWSI
ncbi:MAG: peptide ABC transporter substrate-binding protein [Candidatus Eremiobacteraeota bacterium]|nr:peptide ABC transporter substrate-binding protein [Candidatus Eremiobacteraeota bacterium]